MLETTIMTLKIWHVMVILGAIGPIIAIIRYGPSIVREIKRKLEEKRAMKITNARYFLYSSLTKLTDDELKMIEDIIKEIQNQRNLSEVLEEG